MDICSSGKRQNLTRDVIVEVYLDNLLESLLAFSYFYLGNFHNYVG